MEYRNIGKRFLKFLALPMVFSLFLFIAIRPIKAELDGDKARLLNYLLSNNVEVGMETVNERSHIYYSFEEQKKFVTSDNYNNKQPKSSGEYITYVKEINGEGQIFLYHIPTESMIQLTRVGPNLNPSVSRQGKVAWEGWVYNPDGSGTWQVFAFDGSEIRQLTQGDISVNANISGDYVLFSRKDNLGEWRSEIYSISQKEVRTVALGFKNKSVKLLGDNITYDDGGVFPLKPQDFFLLEIDSNIVPSDNSGSVVPTETPVLATESAVLITETPTPVPTISSPSASLTPSP